MTNVIIFLRRAEIFLLITLNLDTNDNIILLFVCDITSITA